MDCTSGKNRQKAIDAWNHIAKQAGRIKELEETITRQSGYIRELETVYTVCNLETTNANERIAELEARIAELEADYDDSGLLYERDRRIAELEVQLAEEKGGE